VRPQEKEKKTDLNPAEVNLHRKRVRRKTAAERGSGEGMSQKQAGKQQTCGSTVGTQISILQYPQACGEIAEVKIWSKE